MLSPKLRALVDDAIYQVLDNSVFRILAVVVLIPVLLTFGIAATPSGLSVLFGTWSWTWPELGLDTPDAHNQAIDTLLAILIDFAAGSIGILFCIAATAFFVPRMIEKGAADLLFHKPVSRLAFYLSRYLAGLFFVGALSILLVFGMFGGLALVSGYSAVGLLWSALSLTYIFALVYSVCMLVGVVTRSTVASILLTILFFMLNGCVHNFWQGLEATEEFGMGAMSGETVRIDVDEEDEEEESQSTEEEVDDRPGAVIFVHDALGVLHMVLPKTNDADVLAQKLRKTVSPPDFVEEGVDVRVENHPSGWKERDADSAPALVPELADQLGETRLALASEEQWFVLRRRPLTFRERSFRSGRVRRIREKLSEATDLVQAELETLAGDSLDPVSSYPMPFDRSADADLPEMAAPNSLFTYELGGEAVELALFTRDDWLYSVELRRPVGTEPDGVHDTIETLDLSQVRPSWYEERFRTGAPLAYNPWYSVASSLAFAGVMLALGVWRLSRIDF